MRCKQGDLALVVCAPSTPESVGSYVICVRRHINDEVVSGFHVRSDGIPAWVVESASGSLMPWRSPSEKTDFVKERVFNDRCLRPIRDQPGEDETLTWKDVPSEVAA